MAGRVDRYGFYFWNKFLVELEQLHVTWVVQLGSQRFNNPINQKLMKLHLIHLIIFSLVFELGISIHLCTRIVSKRKLQALLFFFHRRPLYMLDYFVSRNKKQEKTMCDMIVWNGREQGRT